MFYRALTTLRKKGGVMGKGERPRNSTSSSPILSAFDHAKNVFWCNTNRGASPGEEILEQRMHDRGFAAIWLPCGYLKHMEQVDEGDMIVMYANGLGGVIGVGKAKSKIENPLGRTNPSRLREYRHSNHEFEYRVPVKWLWWNENQPCYVDFLRPAFQKITHLSERMKKIRRHLSRIEET